MTRLHFLSANKLLAINPANGSEYWHIPWETKYNVHPSSPAYFKNKLFLSAGVNKECALYNLEGNAPKLIWKNKNLRNDFLTSIYHGGYLYGIDGNASRRSRLACIDANSGDVRWKNNEIGFGSLLLVDDNLIILNDQGVLYIAEANPNHYKEQAKKEILTYKCWTPPAIAGGRLYARNANGDLVCVSLRPELWSRGMMEITASQILGFKPAKFAGEPVNNWKLT